ncbi:hypothetical protein J6TS7_23990 [Paenibacillus dendritiformis]|nr:hypothetical protein J6TS7_23990 [Paenibacillus dendritiformis]
MPGRLCATSPSVRRANKYVWSLISNLPVSQEGQYVPDPLTFKLPTTQNGILT